MGRRSHSHRRHATADLGDSFEFADLLDPIRSDKVTVVGHTVARPTIEPAIEPVEAVAVEPAVEPIGELIGEPTADPPTTAPSPEQPHEASAEPAVEPILVSRFADDGMNDDRLPVLTKGRRRHH